MLRFLPLLILLAVPGLASAHNRGASLVEVVARGNDVDVAVAFHAEELGSFDRDGDGVLGGAEVEAAQDRILAASWERIGVGTEAGVCSRGAAQVALDPLGGVRIAGAFRCAGDVGGALDLALGYLDALPPGHRVVGEARFGERVQAFSVDASEPQITLQGGATGGFLHFFVLGVEHIFTGFDHLLFLAGLLLVATGMREVVKLVTSFTVAHSITLGASVLGVVELSSGVVEPLIAASIVVVAVENVVRRSHRGRVGLTFLFGLVHGFGFAGLLRELGLGQGSVAATLAGFNLGVEAGQLAVVLAVAPLLLLSRRQPWYARTAVPGFSAVIGFFGAYWLVERLLG
ncbi:HupE/UreJ family protein [Vulgatibacter sp.]|uniref:HupE/UreJ family protein n=1 Tax=Vulgatibacter sp. TaxID=1971226 RepID=UPI0035670B46